jgi:uncharacterized protein
MEAMRMALGTIENVSERVTSLDWEAVSKTLDELGCAMAPQILTRGECESLTSMYDAEEHFRKRVIMARHGFGRGEYKYFSYPLPTLLQELRTALFPRLAAVANRWNGTLGNPQRYPLEHKEYLEACHSAGQREPTPLILRYGPGDYNCLHQDLYGELVFPFQVAFLLSQPKRDFEGGEFVLVEQRPRMQSRPEVVPLQQGDALIFPVHHRPVHGSRGWYKVNMRHGVSRVRSGKRHTMGIIFHDAQS